MPAVIETASGQAVDVACPDPDTINLDDIAHALAQMCRFGGHTKRFYSVAEHSLFVYRLACTEAPTDHLAQLHALLHDAHEAYLVDLPTPIKLLIEERSDGVWGELEQGLDRAIWVALTALPYPDDPRIHDLTRWADSYALRWEATELLHCGPAWTDYFDGYEHKLPEAYKEMWLRNAHRTPGSSLTIDHPHACYISPSTPLHLLKVTAKELIEKVRDGRI